MTIDELLQEGQPNRVAAALRQHPRYDNDRHYQTSVIMLMARSSQHAKQIQNGLYSGENRAVQNAKLIYSVQMLLEEYPEVRRFTVSTAALPEVIQAPGEREAPLVLFLASNPGDALQMEKEFARVHRNVQDHEDRLRLRHSDRVTRENVRRVIAERKPAYVHFSGHGIGENRFRTAGIVFEHPTNRDKSDVMSAGEATKMFRLLHRNAAIKLVLLNACESADHARMISTQGFYAIGMREEIRDSNAILFADGFYTGLVTAEDQDDPVPHAFRSGVDHLPLELRQLPRLYLDGDDLTPPQP